MSRPDILIAGGGPAGLATAIAASRRGFRVAVIDGRRPPIDKACGEGLMPEALEAMALLGVSSPAAESFPFCGVRFIGSDGVSAAADFPSGFGLGVRRVALHRALVEQAERAGADLRWGEAIKPERFHARWIIGADGGSSQVRRWAGLDSFSRDSRRLGFRRHYRLPPSSDRLEVYWGRGFQIYVTPVAPEEICVALLTRDSRLRLDDALHACPSLAALLAHSAPMSTERGGETATRRLRAVYRDRVVLVGDASGSVDAISGSGLSLAFQHALAVVDAMEHDDLSEYAAAHRRILRRPAFMSDVMLTMDHWPSLETRAMRAFAKRPQIFARLLAMHVGQLPPLNFAAASLDLAWRLLL
jgi:flavin-dependent dehydrogenase